LEAGETYEAAAHRELLEEVGVDTELRRLGKLTPCEATGNEFIEVYGGTHSGPFELAGLEITGGAFFPPEQIDRWSKQRPEDFSPVFRLCWPLWKAAHAAG
jgi:16S rRNA (adenine1518-N6/adenine1519-N6)-dimethyltransferase